MLWKILLAFAFIIPADCSIAKELPPLKAQTYAVRNLIKRAVGAENAQKFTVQLLEVLPFRSFLIEKTASNDAIVIIGTDGLSAAKGFHHYLKYYLKIDINWRNDETVELPPIESWPAVSLNSTAGNRYVYYQNVCTWSYSFAWWGWTQWRRHIDWMAMMGISLTIAPVQEQLWHDLYAAMGLTDDELAEHFAGPAFQAWQRMGNIRGWGGPLPPSYRRMQQSLQRRIVNAQRELGMSVAVAAFAGHVPRALRRLYPNVTLTPVGSWNHFPVQYCCSLFLEPSELLFHEIGTRFLIAVTAAYGSDHLYFADPFNENEPRLAEADYMRETSQHIYNAMRAVDEQAVWLLQGWMFVKNVFWTQTLMEAFLTAVPLGNLLVLDLQSEQFPQYERTRSYYGQPFIWCMLHNFGGTLGMHGSAEIVNRRIGEAARLSNGTLLGVGITPEGIEQNYAMYALALERGWQPAAPDYNLTVWFASYADSRYGTAAEPLHTFWWTILQSVYDYKGIRRLHGRYTITRRPSMQLDTWTWYDPQLLGVAWQQLLAAPVNASQSLQVRAYTHDLVDIGRQFFQALTDRLYINLRAAYKRRQLPRFLYIAAQLRLLLVDLETLLATHDDYLLGRWLHQAQRRAHTPAERQLYALNARNQITAWGPTGQILDYATKQWSGIVRDYYAPRWLLFLEYLEDSFRTNTPFNSRAFKLAVSHLENSFSVQQKRYPNQTNNDNSEALPTAQRLYDKWTALLTDEHFARHAMLHVPLVK